ncbi:MAG: 4Fe-4S binding protein [Clostridiaceae bacterium]|jgi:MinD superfamily P-loop ATPase|nr:4Fe-4S binding protein [Clostridiaceae bacterium]
MRLAVLSGKGGTGKTTVSASLAKIIPGCQYADCDVEEPNGAIFLKPDLLEAKEVRVLVPEVDQAVCTGCGACARICQFSAIAVVRKKVLIFPELCHHCGACVLVCEPGALTEVERPIGTIEASADNTFIQGRLAIGEPSGIPIIDAIKKWLDPDRPAVLDCPPGAGCSVVKSLEGADYALLVTEPTPFGLHDLAIAWSLVQRMGLPAGLVLNKSGPGNEPVYAFCREHQLPVLLEIPFSRSIAVAYASGQLPVDTDPVWVRRFTDLYDRISQEVAG